MLKRLLLSLVLCTTLTAKAEWVDLTGGNLLSEPVACRYNQRQKMCAIVVKDEKYYIVMFDDKGEFSLHEVTVKIEGDQLEVLTSKFLWAREMI